MDFIKALEQQIAAATGGNFVSVRHQSIGGGCINAACHLQGKSASYFVKLNRASLLDMFIAEAAGLQAMADTNTIRVPLPVCHGVIADQCYLVMEWLELGGRGDRRLMGEQLAAMHRHTSEQFGWDRDNTIGSTPQPNRWNENWVVFWQQQRLGHQLALARKRGYGGNLQKQGARLLERIADFFSSYQPEASLLHGDLWSGNASFTTDGSPVIFDPAVYYGDREADLAMTELFGGFGADFFAAYNGSWPLDSGYQVRKTLYNLYHIINHLNLFGGGYLNQAESMIQRLLVEVS